MDTAKKNCKVMVFGVFDRLHAGHLYFLRQAAKNGEVVAVVARDSSAKELKNKRPLQNEKERGVGLKKTGLVKNTILGDSKLGAYKVIEKIKPDIICLGYDQKVLEEDLRRYFFESGRKVKIIKIKSFKPDELHTSFLEIPNS